MSGLLSLHDIPAPAKLNLFLHVIGRRPDGYHLLQSTFALIDWCDVLHFERRDDKALLRHDLGPPLPADDLCLRAARALQAASGSRFGVDIHLSKQVPWGAGLGGGSSDAASTLLALNRLWGLNWSRHQLMALALPLGADIPFFLGGNNAFVQGIGEQLTPVQFPPQWFAVVKPQSSIATAGIFTSPLLARNSDPVIVTSFLASIQQPQRGGLGAGADGGFGRNDLQPVAEAMCPEVTQVAEWLRARFGNSRMSGSGSAVFARAGTGVQPVATWSKDEIPADWVGRMCRSLVSHPLAGWVG